MTESNSWDLKAEVYSLTTLQHKLQDYDGFHLDCQGTRERGRNKDVLGLQPHHSVMGHKVVELLGMQVSRNGIYHMLPESLFQPLSLGTTASNTYEILEEMRQNRTREAGNRLFFVPFDTELFRFSRLCMQRQLGWPGEQPGAIRRFLAQWLGHDFGLNEERSLHLLAFFTNAESAKDNAPLLASFLTALLEHEVTIIPRCLAVAPATSTALGKGRLGVDTVLAGFSTAEVIDWEVEVTYRDVAELTQAAMQDGVKEFVEAFLEYFVLASRLVRVTLKAAPGACSTELGQGILGLHLHLHPQAA